MAGLHDTTTDGHALRGHARPSHAADIAQARAWLDGAGRMARAERALRLPGATPDSVAARALDWAEIRGPNGGWRAVPPSSPRRAR